MLKIYTGNLWIGSNHLPREEASKAELGDSDLVSGRTTATISFACDCSPQAKDAAIWKQLPRNSG